MAGSFNYISFGNWEHVEGLVSVVSMGRGRMFEYTPPDTGKRLESLDSTAIAFLEKLPTFLCTEVRSIDDAVSMLIKYGRISNTTPEQRDVSTTFETLIDVGEVQFDHVEAAASVFGVDRFQLYRTHWAVREGEAQEVLARLASIKPDHARLIAEKRAIAANGRGVQPPTRDKKILGVADSVESFLRLPTVNQRTQAINALRGHAAEFGVVAAQGCANVAALLAVLSSEPAIPTVAKTMFEQMGQQSLISTQRSNALEKRLLKQHKANAVSKLLGAIPRCRTNYRDHNGTDGEPSEL